MAVEATAQQSAVDYLMGIYAHTVVLTECFPFPDLLCLVLCYCQYRTPSKVP